MRRETRDVGQRQNNEDYFVVTALHVNWKDLNQNWEEVVYVYYNDGMNPRRNLGLVMSELAMQDDVYNLTMSACGS